MAYSLLQVGWTAGCVDRTISRNPFSRLCTVYGTVGTSYLQPERAVNPVRVLLRRIYVLYIQYIRISIF